MPIATAWLRPLPQRARRSLAALLLLGTLAGLASLLARRKGGAAEAPALCHPSLSRLSAEDGTEVLLIGTLSLDLDGASGELVHGALRTLRPDVVMVEGTWTAGVSAMLHSGRWELHGAPPAPGKVNWTDIGDAEPVELPRPKRRGLLSFSSAGPARWPERSLVPVKVGSWAFHLRGSVGGGIAAALTTAAASGVPLHFLGPADGGFQGHVHVTLLAQQAAQELLEEEQQRGAQMAPDDVDAALRRAESHVRDEADRWLHDARKESSRFEEHLHSDRMPAKVRETVAERLEQWTQGLAERIDRTMQEHSRGAVVLAVEQLVAVEGKLLDSGYAYVSNCA